MIFHIDKIENVFTLQPNIKELLGAKTPSLSTTVRFQVRSGPTESSSSDQATSVSLFKFISPNSPLDPISLSRITPPIPITSHLKVK